MKLFLLLRGRLRGQLRAHAVRYCGISLGGVERLPGVSRAHTALSFHPAPLVCFHRCRARLPGGRLQAGAVLPAETASAVPLRQPPSEPFPWLPVRALPGSCSCDTCPCGIPLSGALGGSVAWVQLAAASTQILNDLTQAQPVGLGSSAASKSQTGGEHPRASHWLEWSRSWDLAISPARS